MENKEIKNQWICAQLVEREVLHCASYMVSELGKLEQFQDDILELYSRCVTIDDCELIDDGTLDTVIAIDGEQHRFDADWASEYRDENGAIIDEDELFQAAIDDVDPEPREVFEHWIVTSWFAGKLAEHGEVTGELFDFHIWGRGTTGQSISMDWIIHEIASEMEILVGQKNSWDKE